MRKKLGFLLSHVKEEVRRMLMEKLPSKRRLKRWFVERERDRERVLNGS